MSFTAIRVGFRLIASVKMSASARLVYLALANFHNQETGRCDPSIRRICESTQCSERSVRDALRELEKLGLLQTVFRQASTGRGKKNLTSRYRLKGGANSAATLGQKLPPNQEPNPSAFDDLAMSIEIMGEQ